MSGGTVSLPLAEWMAKESELRAAQDEVSRLRTALAVAEQADPSGRIQTLVTGMRAARVLVPLAMQAGARAWPYAALVTFADVLEAMPGSTIDDSCAAIDMRKFAAGEEAIRLYDPALVRERSPAEPEPPPAPVQP